MQRSPETVQGGEKSGNSSLAGQTKVTRRDFLKVSGGVVAAAGLAPLGQADAQTFRGSKPRPNILFITADDLGRHVGCFGIETVHTPRIDGLAAFGVRFADAFNNAPSCSPSRSALATGRYPHSNGVMGLSQTGRGWDLNPGERHAAAIFKEAGYSTHVWGKRHVGPAEKYEEKGFDEVHRGGDAPDVAADFASFLDDSRPS